MFDPTSIIGAIVGGGMSYLGQRSANRANKAAAARSMHFSHGEAQNQMDFQERMSGTAYQRAMHDMKTAGLNPMLAANMSGASTPGGAAGSGAQHTEVNEFASAISSAQQAAAAASNISLSRAQTALLKQQASAVQFANVEAKVEADYYNSKTGNVMKQSDLMLKPITNFLETLSNTWSDVKGIATGKKKMKKIGF